MLIWTIVFTILITVVVAFRFWAAWIKRRSLRPDDYFILLAFVRTESFPSCILKAHERQLSTLVSEAVTWWGIANGLGAHTFELNRTELGVQYKVIRSGLSCHLWILRVCTPKLTQMHQLLLSGGITWLFATLFCKLSILWFYICIFATRKFKIVAWILMSVVIIYGVAFVCVFLTRCHPVSYSHHPIPSSFCTSVPVSLNMIIDIAVVVLPLPPLWRLQMATRNKISITFLFSLGLL